jgi:hypothetical protein
MLAFYHRLWLPGLVLTKRDAFGFFLPLKQYMIERLSAGELPQWFPYEAFGRPFIGIPVTGVFHPFTLLYFMFSVPDGYRLSVLLSCLLAGLGSFALARTLEVSPFGSLLAGIAFSCSGFVVSLTENLTYLYSVCLLPLFCATLDRALIRGTAWVAGAALLWASVFLNGDVQTGYYYGFVAAFWTFARTWGAYRAALWRLVCVATLAGLVAAIQLAPAAAVFANSYRVDAETFHKEALVWSMHPLRLVTVLASPIGGEAQESDVALHFFGGLPPWKSPTGFWAETVYLGLPVVGLALLGALRRRNLRWLVALCAVFLVLSLGRYGGLYDLFYRVVPLWSAFRYPERLMGVATLVLVTLAGVGLDRLRQRETGCWFWFAAAALCAAASLGLRGTAAGVAAATAFAAPPDVATEVTRSSASAFLFAAGTAGAMGLAGLGFLTGQVHRKALLALVMAVIVTDLWRANQDAYHTGPVEAAAFYPGVARAVAEDSGVSGPGAFRVLTVEESLWNFPELLDKSLDVTSRNSILFKQVLDIEHNAAYHIESVKIYLPGYSPPLARLMDLQRGKMGLDAYARFNVAYIIGRLNGFQNPMFERRIVAVVPDYNIALVRNPVRPKKRAYLSLMPERASSPVDLVSLVMRPDFLSGEVDVVESPDGSLPGPPLEGRVEMERYAPEEVRIRVETPEPGVLILLDAYDAGWQATIDQAETVPILRANGLTRAVIVPAGEHVVTFTYETPFLKVGAVGSALGAALCTILLVASVLRRGPSPRAPSGVVL